MDRFLITLHQPHNYWVLPIYIHCIFQHIFNNYYTLHIFNKIQLMFLNHTSKIETAKILMKVSFFHSIAHLKS